MRTLVSAATRGPGRFGRRLQSCDTVQALRVARISNRLSHGPAMVARSARATRPPIYPTAGVSLRTISRSNNARHPRPRACRLLRSCSRARELSALLCRAPAPQALGFARCRAFASSTISSSACPPGRRSAQLGRELADDSLERRLGFFRDLSLWLGPPARRNPSAALRWLMSHGQKIS